MKLSLGKKIVILIILLAVLLSGTCIAVSGIVNRRTMDNEYVITADSLASTVAVIIDSERMERITDKVMELYYASDNKVSVQHSYDSGFSEYVEQYLYLMEDEDYIALREELRKIQEVCEADNIYTMCVCPADKTTVYIVDAGDGEDFWSPGYFDILDENCYPYLDDLSQGFPTFITDSPEYGWVVTACTPVFSSKGNVICFACVDLDMNDVLETEKRFLFMLAGILLGLTLTICITAIIYVKKKIVKPINMLSETAGKYGQKQSGENDSKFSSLSIHTGDELEILLNSMVKMENDIDRYIDSLTQTKQQLSTARQQADDMHELAHMDALTGIRNKLAYDKETAKIDGEIANGGTSFGIAMIDLNFLKVINDTYGHEYGNETIKELSRLICSTFVHSMVFRIGGDEFAVILRNSDYEKIELLENEFNQKLLQINGNSALKPWEKISAAFGYALFDKTSDLCADDVFKRADHKMYERKKEMKAMRK